MSTTLLIHFVGLLTLVSPSGPTPHILVPRFADIIKKQANVIRVPTSALATSAWESTPGPDGFTDFYIEEQTISITGSTAYTNNAGALPRLTCCCQAMKEGLSPDYNDPNPDLVAKKGAYINLNSGNLFTEIDMTTSAVHVDLEVTPANNQVVITGVRNKKTQTLVLNVPASGPKVEIVFLNVPDDSHHDSHWRHYYKMARVANNCSETPKADPDTCGPQTSGCLTEQGAAKTTTATATIKKAAAGSPKGIKSRLPKWFGMLFIDVNCSSSQWP